MQKMFRYPLLLLSLFLSLAIVSSCRPKDEDAVIAVIKEARVDFPNKANTRTITVKTNVDDWQAHTDVSWCRVSGSGNTVKISVDENRDSKLRTATIVINFRNISKTVIIRQLGKALAILTNKDRIPVSAKGGGIEFTVTANVETKFQLPSWIKPSEARALMKDHKYRFTVEANNVGRPRSAAIVILQKGVDESQAIKKNVIVEQKFDGKYQNTTEGITKDLKLRVATATASQSQNGAGIEKSYDGNMDTNYHSPFHDKTKMPVTLTYNFAKLESLDYIVYHPRKSGNNGNFKLVDIYVSQNGSNFQKVLTKDLKGSSLKTKIDFGRTVQAKSVRFVVKSGVGYDNKQFAACAEMEFYQNHPNKFDYNTLFVDELCSKLKADVTLKDIQACKQPFYRNIALHLFNGTYQKDFRIAEFKLYLNPDEQARVNKTNPYSKRDNPTGIEVKANEELVVFAGHLHGITDVRLCVQNLDVPNGDGFGGKEYQLHTGLNRIKIKEKGLVYVLYMTKNWNILKRTGKLKLHFATGTVNGYYDAQNPKHRGRANELLAAAKGKFFDIVGKYAHLTFPTENFRSTTKNIDKLINTYDELVKSEMELLGLFKYNKVFKNRMYLCAMYRSHMHAVGYHTSYNVNTLHYVLDEDRVARGDCWGPAHEIGHMNQTYGLKWRGLTEVTNNIMAEYVTTRFGAKSRIFTENKEWGNNRYTWVYNHDFIKKHPFLQTQSPFSRLVPFWQLQLYFGKALGRTPEQQGDKGGFYPAVYEYYRTHDTSSDVAIQQSEFVYVASKIAGYNLIPFFEKWGFLTPVNMEINEYGKSIMNLTQARVNETKRRIEALRLPKLNAPIEYITDGNIDIFKNKQAVVKGADARWRGIDILINDWKNVVAYEVWNKPYGSAGAKLVYAGDGVNVKELNSRTAKLAVVRNYIGQDTPAYLYAVDVNNKRIAIPLK